ncbi:MAG: HEAT repeat domain-containing protein [Ignavibacteriales bacterium]|nr:HEAT repeat domain-containing protein [Ignavibacteriales bacterium]
MDSNVYSIEQLLSDQDPDVRRQAAESLEHHRGLRAAAALAAALKDANQGVRDAAGRSLCTIGGEDTARLVAEYIADGNIITRNLAGALLVQLGVFSVPAILPYLQDVDQDVRKFAVDLLGLIKSKETVGPILPLLRDKDPNVVVSAVEALGNIGDGKIIPELLVTYQSYDYARVIVVEALGKLRDSTVSPFLAGVFEELAADKKADPLLLFAVLEALSAVGDAEAFQVLYRYENSVKGKLKHALLASMIQIAERHDVSIEATPDLEHDLLELLQDDDLKFREHAVKILSVYEDSAVTRAFVRLLGSSESIDNLLYPLLCQRRDALVLAAEELPAADPGKKSRIVHLLVRMASDHHNGGLEMLFQPGGESALDMIFDAVQEVWGNADEETRSFIVDALFLFDGARAVEFLGAVLYEPDPWLRVHVVEILGKVEHGDALTLLKQFVHDEDEMVRDLAVSTLANRGYFSGSVEPVNEDSI